MLTRQEIEEWHNPPRGEQAEWLLKLADRFIGCKPSKEEIGLSIMPTVDLSSPDFLRKKAEECLALSYQIDDPKKQVAILRLANWWMRLAEHYIITKSAAPRREVE
jgi:hypothetical protein